MLEYLAIKPWNTHKNIYNVGMPEPAVFGFFKVHFLILSFFLIFRANSRLPRRQFVGVYSALRVGISDIPISHIMRMLIRWCHVIEIMSTPVYNADAWALAHRD